MNYSKLTKVTIKSKKLSTIGKGAFWGCKKLTKIILKTTKLKTVGKNSLKGMKANCKIVVPKAQVKKYTKLFKNKGLKTVKVTK